MHNSTPPGEALATAVAALGSVAGSASVVLEMQISDQEEFVSTLITWTSESGETLKTATVLVDGSVIE